jgi:hypothetical protein
MLFVYPEGVDSEAHDEGPTWPTYVHPLSQRAGGCPALKMCSITIREYRYNLSLSFHKPIFFNMLIYDMHHITPYIFYYSDATMVATRACL